MSQHPAGTGAVESVEVVVVMPPDLAKEIEEYAGRWKSSTSWALRRTARLLLDEEDRQAAALAALSRRAPGRPRRAA
jgi:hypothetical protein